MPRKIDVAKTLKALEQAGYKVSIEKVEPSVKPEAPKKALHPAFIKNIKQPSHVKITLYAKHSIGSGGSLVLKDGQKVTENAGVETYGPGVVTVPIDLVNQLLHQDQLCRQADARFLEREQRSYIVTQRVGPHGQMANAAVQVEKDFFGNGFDVINAVKNGLYITPG